MNPASNESIDPNKIDFDSKLLNPTLLDPVSSLTIPEDESTRESLNEEIKDLQIIQNNKDETIDSNISSQNVTNFERINKSLVKTKIVNPDAALVDKYLRQISN